MPGRRALLLDLDGTLADSLPVMRQAYFRLMEQVGATGSDSEFDELNGPPLAVAATLLCGRHHLSVSPEHLTARWLRLINSEYMKAPPAEGAASLVATARRHGWRIGIVTSSVAALARRWLDGSGLADKVDTIVGGDEVRHGKPAPDPYLLALERLGCEASASLAIEDSPGGATSALAAGIHTLVLTHSHPGPFPPAAHPVRMLTAALPLVEEL